MTVMVDDPTRWCTIDETAAALDCSSDAARKRVYRHRKANPATPDVVGEPLRISRTLLETWIQGKADPAVTPDSATQIADLKSELVRTKHELDKLRLATAAELELTKTKLHAELELARQQLAAAHAETESTKGQLMKVEYELVETKERLRQVVTSSQALLQAFSE